jgi:D-tyrosyl-tRNA(Tyr) deacylase|tara:strand:+ start:2781 stop:3227 length:447 start_codon:yes stop_codon:yes gene_type:complete
VKALLQRVTAARVTVGERCVGEIGSGLLVFLGLEQGDQREAGLRLLDRLLSYRIFPDDQGRMNRSVRDAGGEVLLVSQFTLAADTRKGLRPGFSTAMAPDEAEAFFAWMLAQLRERHAGVAAGEFGANMQVSLVNDGPVTFLLEASPA